MIALHGWPQHHWAYRDLLADPPPGLRIIAPDLPGYGWSGPPPHKWAKDDVAADVLALMDALGLDKVLLVGHDWGGFVGYRMILGARAVRRLPGDEHGAPVADAAHQCCRICGAALPDRHRDRRVPLQDGARYLEKVIYASGPTPARRGAAGIRR